MEAVENTQKVFAVDGDIIAYRSAAVCENEFEGAAESIIRTTLRDIATETGVTHMRIYLSGRNNFRYDVGVTKPYKGNRATMVKPQYLDHCKKYLAETYGAICIDTFEADDLIATDMTVNGAIHCGIDKDLLQIAGTHYNYVKKEFVTISADEAILRLYRQILQGDTSDNIPGLPRIGEKKAADAIQDPKTAKEDCMAMYENLASAIPEVENWMIYLAEQTKLISMVTDVSMKFDNTYVFDISDGFEKQEGEFVSTPEPIKVIRL